MSGIKRAIGITLAALSLQATVLCAPLSGTVTPKLTSAQAAIFRAWFVRIVVQQIRRGPAAQWVARDCAGLVRYAVREALRPHDTKWRRAHGLIGELVPPEPSEAPERQLGPISTRLWMLPDHRSRGPFVTAMGLIQNNSEPVAKEINLASPGDLLFFDQGEDQHLMIYLGGSAVAYHTGHVSPQDDGLRLVSISQLMHWKDTRWQPTIDNPNFIGVYRLAFLPR